MDCSDVMMKEMSVGRRETERERWCGEESWWEIMVNGEDLANPHIGLWLWKALGAFVVWEKHIESKRFEEKKIRGRISSGLSKEKKVRVVGGDKAAKVLFCRGVSNTPTIPQ